MARWTRRVGWFTGALVIVSIVTAWIFKGQLNIMQGQLDQMREQTTTIRAQVRANIGTEVVGFDRYIQNGMFAGWDVTPKWKNTGATDALDYRANWGVVFKLGPNIKWSASDCPQITVPPETPSIVISAGHPVAQISQKITVGQALQVEANEASLFIAGRIEYRDIFPDDPLHYIDWCSRIIFNDIDQNLVSLLALKNISR